jgi:hypothetical protein
MQFLDLGNNFTVGSLVKSLLFSFFKYPSEYLGAPPLPRENTPFGRFMTFPAKVN